MGFLDRFKRKHTITPDVGSEPLQQRLAKIRKELDNILDNKKLLDKEFDSGKVEALSSEEDCIWSVIVGRNMKGQELEKKGDIEGAIQLYEQNIVDEVETPHPYNRLAIIYRRKKCLDDEIRVLEKAISVFKNLGGNVSDWQKQLAKAKAKQPLD